MRQRRLHVALLIVLAPLLLGLALIIPQAIRLDQPWDIATLRQPNEIKHRVVAIMSGITEQPRVLDEMQPIANTAEPSLGVNTFFEQEVDEATIRRSMELISDAGFQWIRQQFAWYEIERPAKGEYIDSASDRSSWDKYDRIVRLANEYGLSIMARIDTVPDWARPTGSTFTHPPTRLEDYGDFVQTLVTRYRDSIHYYQLWNEPNLGFEWGGQDVKASEYVPLLKEGYAAVKAADADAVVIAAALAPTVAPGPDNRNETLYLQEMYDAGAKDSFDVMSTMAYGLSSGPDDRRVDAWHQVNLSRAQLLREIMNANGDGAKPIWFSELAWNALPPDMPGRAIYGRVTEDQQARYTVRGLQRKEEEWPWVGAAFVWFFRRPDEHEKDQQYYYFRLVNPDFTQMPVYDAVKQAAPSMRVVQRGVRSATHWAIDRRGEWQQTDASLQTRTVGSALSFTYNGTDLLITAQGPGRLLVDSAGTSLQRAPDGMAYVDLPAGESQVTVARGLPGGTHQVTLALAHGRVAISQIVVEDQEPLPFNLLAAAAMYAVVWGIVWRGWQ